MSLDLYIRSRRPIHKRGTGIFIREKGRLFELKTLEDVRAYFPDKDLSHITIDEYEDYDFWHGNITHNMKRMASAVLIEGTELTLCDLLWRPDECGVTTVGSPGYKENVRRGFLYLRRHREDLSLLNPENGWGNYKQLFEFTRDYLLHLNTAEDDFKIEVSR